MNKELETENLEQSSTDTDKAAYDTYLYCNPNIPLNSNRKIIIQSLPYNKIIYKDKEYDLEKLLDKLLKILTILRVDDLDKGLDSILTKEE